MISAALWNCMTFFMSSCLVSYLMFLTLSSFGLKINKKIKKAFDFEVNALTCIKKKVWH